MRNQSCHLDTGAIDLYPRASTPSPSPSSKDQVFIKNSWVSKTNRLKMWINLEQLREQKKRCKPPCFSCLLLSQKLGTSAGTASPSIPRVYSLFIPRHISTYQPLPELCEVTLRLPHLQPIPQGTCRA